MNDPLESTEVGTPVDGHAHWYPQFGQEAFLEGALRHLRAAGSAGRAVVGALLLADPLRCDTLASWRRSFVAGRWRLEETGEAESILARHVDGAAIALIAGRQLVTAERIEVLALAGVTAAANGLPIEVLVEQIAGEGLAEQGAAVPVLPWGFGKWSGQRGRIVGDVVRRHVQRGRPFPLLVGDSGGRPRGFAEPALLKLAKGEGLGVIAGSDPLPLAGHAQRAGRFGFIMPGALDAGTPAAQIRRFLRQEQGCCGMYGRRESLIEFMSAQLMLRLGRGVAKLPGEHAGSDHASPNRGPSLVCRGDARGE